MGVCVYKGKERLVIRRGDSRCPRLKMKANGKRVGVEKKGSKKEKGGEYTERDRESDIVAQSVNENELPHHQLPHHHYYSIEQLLVYITKISSIAFIYPFLGRCFGFDLDAIINRLVRVV